MEIKFNGLALQIQVLNHTPARREPIAQTPDHQGYPDPGDMEEIEFLITSVDIIRKGELISHLRDQHEEELGDLICNELG